MAGEWAIEVNNLRREFDVGRRAKRRTIVAVDGISFDVSAGERLAFIGPNGAGKSTSIKMLTGILHPTGGSASVLGIEPWSDRRALTRRIGTLFGQRSQLWSELVPRSSLCMLGAIYGIDDRNLDRRIDELAELFEADELFEQPVRTLSLGQRMRCELAACMLHQPELLFLDEPTIGLDLTGKQRFRELLVRLNTELGTTVFLTSHDVADIEYVADRAIVVNHGSIVNDASVAEMRSGLLGRKRIEVGLIDAGGGAALAATLTAAFGADIDVLERSASVVSIDVDTTRRPIREVLDHLLDAVPVADLSVVDPPLEQVIGEIYERPQ
jgi:ABC-2 type transport system ATP-binding protein